MKLSVYQNQIIGKEVNKIWMSQFSRRLERRSVEFNIQHNPNIDPTAPTMSNLDKDTINALVSAIQ